MSIAVFVINSVIVQFLYLKWRHLPASWAKWNVVIASVSKFDSKNFSKLIKDHPSIISDFCGHFWPPLSKVPILTKCLNQILKKHAPLHTILKLDIFNSHQPAPALGLVQWCICTTRFWKVAICTTRFSATWRKINNLVTFFSFFMGKYFLKPFG